MPYEIKKVKGGHKVFKKGTKKSYSKKPMTKKMAKRQMAAIYANESFEQRLDRIMMEADDFSKGELIQFYDDGRDDWITAKIHNITDDKVVVDTLTNDAQYRDIDKKYVTNVIKKAK